MCGKMSYKEIHMIRKKFLKGEKKKREKERECGKREMEVYLVLLSEDACNDRFDSELMEEQLFQTPNFVTYCQGGACDSCFNNSFRVHL